MRSVSYTHLPGDGWNVYSEIKRKLTEDYGIPPSEVRFIQECKTDKARKAVIDAMTEDWNRFLSVVQTDKEGNHLNIIKVDGVDSADERCV